MNFMQLMQERFDRFGKGTNLHVDGKFQDDLHDEFPIIKGRLIPCAGSESPYTGDNAWDQPRLIVGTANACGFEGVRKYPTKPLMMTRIQPHRV